MSLYLTSLHLRAASRQPKCWSQNTEGSVYVCVCARARVCNITLYYIIHIFSSSKAFIYILHKTRSCY